VRTVLLVAALVLFSVGVGFYGYYAGGRADAADDAPYLARHAMRLVAQGQGPDDLGPGRAEVLLAVQEPEIFFRDGVDLDTADAGKSALSYEVAQPLAFDHDRSEIAKLRQAGYGLGLEKRLTKRQILALWLETVDMGMGPEGPMRGFFGASRAVFGKSPARLSDDEFVRLAAAVIAPRRLHLDGEDRALDNRVRRIEKLLARACRPEGNGDVWLEGCAGA